MKIIVRALGAAFLTAGLLAVPSVAQAAEDEPVFSTLTERDEAGKTIVYPIEPGATIPVVLGVTNRGTAPAAGFAVNIRVLDDVNLPKTFTNCQYYVDSNLDGAWCEFDETLPVGGTYALVPFQVAVEPDAEKLSSVIFEFYSKAYVDEKGGIAALAKADSRQGDTPVAGTQADLTVQPRELPVPAETSRVGFAYLKLVTPSTPPTTPSDPPSWPAPSGSATASPSTSPTGAAGGAGGDGGGLPLTGANTSTVIGAGSLLLLIGGIIVAAVRRRTKFTA